MHYMQRDRHSGKSLTVKSQPMENMEIEEGKYYTQYNVLYKCTRSSGTALVHDLYDLRGHYVELIES